MWLATTEGFYSVIRWHDGRMCVRARQADDLKRLRAIVPTLSKTEVSPGRDYRYRCFCTVDEWAAGAEALARTIDYGNFKSAVLKKQGRTRYEEALHQVWSVFSRLQPAGPYGFGTRKGFPAVPKGEAKQVEKAREDDRLRFGATVTTSSAPTGQARLFGGSRNRTGPLTHCEDCGDELDSGEIAWIDGQPFCKSIGDCIDRMPLSL